MDSFIANDTAEDFLKTFGLTENEIMIYSFIAKTGPQKATTIAQKLKIHKIQAYRCLSEMEKKGIVQQIFKEPKRFAASPIENLLSEKIDSMQESIKKLTEQKEKICADWNARISTENADKSERFAVLEGEDKLRAAVEGLRKRAKKHLCTIITQEALVRVNLRGDHDNIMNGKTHFKYRVLTQTQEPKAANFDFVVDRLLKSPNVEIRYLRTQLSPFQRFGLTEDEVVLFTTNEHEDFTTLWTNNETIVGLITEYFERLWKEAGDTRNIPSYE